MGTLVDSAFDAFPSFVFVVDEDVRIHSLNRAALQLTGSAERAEVILRRAGDALKCVNSFATPGGCSCADACKTCIVRNSVGECLRKRALVRNRTRFSVDHGQIKDAFFLLTATPFEHEGKTRVLLVLEDLAEQIRMRGVLPICAHCHRVRNEQNQWEDVQRYVAGSLAMDWSHGICDECLEKHYPDDD
jgi:PAS domain-containing protein